MNGKLISELLEEDKKAFKPLPRIEFETARYMPVRTNKYGQFKLHKGKHTYSASPALCEEEICVKLTSSRVTVINGKQQEIVSHRRLYGDQEQICMDWVPYLKYIARKPRSLRNTGIYQMIPQQLQRYLDKCTSSQCGQVLKLIAELTARSGFDKAIKTVEAASIHDVHDMDSLKSLHRRIFSEVPELDPIDTSGGILDVAPIVQASINDYDCLLMGGAARG